MINRAVTRTVLNSDEVTNKTAFQSVDTQAFNLQTTDSFYLGSTGKFSSRYFDLKAPNGSASVLTVQYWNGSTWVDVDDLVDQTSQSGKTMYKSGFISWVNKTDWVKCSLTGVDSDVELYWVKLTVSANLDSGTIIQSIANLFSDDDMLRIYYPEIANDPNYLPDGKKNFVDQHWAAKNLVVLRLKQRKLIADESQIIDISDVAQAAVHAVAWIIINPIASSDEKQALAARAWEAFGEEINSTNLHVDQDKDGILSDAEKTDLNSTWVTRR